MGVSRKGRLAVSHTSQLVEGRRHPILKVTCAICGATDQININKNAGDLPDVVIAKKFRQKGWRVTVHDAICPLHSGIVTSQHKATRRESVDDVLGEMIASIPIPPQVIHSQSAADLAMLDQIATDQLSLLKETAMPLPVEPIRTLSALGDETARTMDRATKRRIYDEVAGVWDESRGRYMGNNSDEQIARDLKLPRAWVEEVRVEFFGESGANGDMDEFKTELDAKIKDAEKLTASALKLAENYETVTNEMKALRTRLQRIETQVLPRR